MPARVQVVVEASDATGGIFRSLANQLGGLGGVIEEITTKNISWGNVATQVTQFVVDGMKESIKVTQEYNAAVRDQMLLSGQSAEASSRFLQVLDDYELSAEDAKAATKALTREGLAPTIETIIELSKQYQELNTVEEKNAFVQKNLGRAGQEWLNLLNQGPDAIEAMNAAVKDGLILTEQNIQASEDYRLALDEWNDSVMALKVSIGNELLPILTDLINQDFDKAMERGAEATGVAGLAVRAFTQDVQLADDAKDTAAKLSEELAARELELAEAVSEIDYKSLIGSIQSYQKEIDRYEDKNRDLKETEQDLMTQRRLLQTQLNDLTTKGYGPSSKAVQDLQGKIGDVNKKLGDNKQALADNATAHREWAAQTVFSFAMARAGADGMIDNLEGEVLVQAGQALGLFDQKTADTMRSVNRAFDTLDATNAQDTIATLTDQLNTLVNTNWTIYINAVQDELDTPGLPGDTNCFVEGTEVYKYDLSKCVIESLQEGDAVITYDTQRHVYTPAKITKVYRHEPSEMGEYYLVINDRVRVTPNHLMYVNGDWKAAGLIVINDNLQDINGRLEKVYSIGRVYKKVRTYNLEVDHDNHNFFASNVLVHNGKQTGGTVMAGNPYLVGERGAEPFIPSVNGRILGHAESLHALSMGGGGGSIGPFYGNVTLQIGEETGAGIMSMR